jgi:hypothetical protein
LFNGKHIYTFNELSFNGCKDKEKTKNQAMKTDIKKKGDAITWITSPSLEYFL